MKFDDRALLTAYLDDELSAAERARVELALAASAHLQRELGELARVRDLTTDLPTPLPPHSVASGVIEAVADFDPRTIRFEKQTRVAMLWVAVGVVAASFALAWSLQLIQLRDGSVRRGATLIPHELAAVDKQVPPAAPLLLPQPALEVALAPPEILPGPSAVVVNESDLRLLTGQEHLREILGRADVRRIVVTLDSLASEQLEKIDGLLHIVPRSEPVHARLTLSPGVAYDPSNPGDAVVFAAVLDEAEYANLQRRLQQLLGNAAAHEEPTAPATVALLSEVGEIAFSEVQPAATTLAARDEDAPTFGSRFNGKEPELQIDNQPDPDDLRRARSSPGAPGMIADDAARNGRPHPQRRAPNFIDFQRRRVSPEVGLRDLDSVIRRLSVPGARLVDDDATLRPARLYVCLIWVKGNGPRP